MKPITTFSCGILLLLFPFILIGQNRDSVDSQNSPNIILLVTDDHRWDALGAYGNDIIQTPNIDQMADQGSLFENMFVTNSICGPSRATIMLGQYPSQHGIRDLDTNLTRNQLQNSYMGQLKRVGYNIGFIGKWGVGTPPDDFLNYDRTFPGQGHFIHKVDGKKRHLTSIMGDQAVEYLDQRAESNSPFMLSISFKTAHIQDSYHVTDTLYPYDPSLSDLYKDTVIPMPEKSDHKYYEQLPEFLKNSENRIRWAVRFWGPQRAQETFKGYYRLISGVDQQVGRIRNKLNKLGLDDNTIIIFTSENGHFMGEYGWTGKWLAYEESIRIPLIIYDPRLESGNRGQRLQEQALTNDIAPTILDLAGVDNKSAMQGRSLVPLLQGEQIEWRTEFFYEHLFDGPKRNTILKSEAVRTERWKYIRYVDQEPVYEQLFDLQNGDPLETQNLMLKEGHNSVKKMMRKKWEKWHEKVRENPSF